MTNIESSLKTASASIFGLALKSWNFHLNLVGPNFFEYHKLLDGLYKHLLESFDGMSEQIRTLDMIAPATLASIHSLSIIEDDEQLPPALEMLHELLLDNERLISLLAEVNGLIGSHLGLQNFIQGLIQEQEKWSWILRSSIRE